MIRNYYMSLYVVTVAIFLIAIAIGIHKKAYEAVAPPIYDPIGYYAKSQSVWDSIHKGKALEVFSNIPSRPPGTALIVYPFGFVSSIKSFLFRSTVAPIVIWALALIIVILPKIRNFNEMLAGLALTAGLLALPIFYHFEIPIDSDRSFGISIQWGLVDVLQGSVGALAGGFIYTGVRKRIKSMVLIAWLLGAYTFFIKPSGILVIGCLFLIYITESVISWKLEIIKRKTLPCIFAVLLCLGIAITAASIWLAFFGGYLSREIIQTAQAASQILTQNIYPSLWSQMRVLMMPVFGIWWFIPITITSLVVVGISLNSLLKMRFSDIGLRVATSAIIFSGALYWWVTMAGQEHRYLFPFIMLIMSWLIIPTLFEWLISLGNKTRYLGIVYFLVPVFAIIALLNIQQRSVSSKIEKIFGYNLDVAQYQDEVKMGHYLLQEARKTHRPTNIYSIGNCRVGAVEMIDWVNSIENEGEAHHFTIYRVNDWIHPGVKIKQLLSCDYFIIEKSYLEGIPSIQTDPIRWQDEESTLTRFINTSAYNSDSGIKLLRRGNVLLYKVENRGKLLAVTNQWVASHKWSDDFWIRNAFARGDFDSPGLNVIDIKVADAILSKTSSLLPPVDFGQKITLLALLRDIKNPTAKNGDDLLTFLFRANEEIPMKYAIFIHLMDKDKKIIFQHDFQIDPEGGIITHGTIWKSLVPILENELAKTYSIGFGAYIPNKDGTFLESNCKQSDWNGNRVILPLK